MVTRGHNSNFDSTMQGFLAGLLLISVLLIMPSLALSQENLIPEITTEEISSDPLAEEMNAAKVLRRLEVSRNKLKAAMDKPTRSQWVHVKQLQQMQLERLGALDEDFPLETIDYPPNTPPFPLSYLDQTRQKYREISEIHARLKAAYSAADNRIEASQKTFTSAKQQLTGLDEDGGTAEQKNRAELDYELGMESLIYARLDARLLNKKLKQAENNLAHIGAIIPIIQKEVVFSEQDYKLQLDNVLERERLLNEALDKTTEDLSTELSKPKDQRVHDKTLESLQNVLREALSYLQYENQIWEERRQIYNGEAGAETAVKWASENALKRSEISELLKVKVQGEKQHTKILLQKVEKQSAVAKAAIVELQKDILVRRQLAFDNLEAIVALLDNHLADLAKMGQVDKFNYLKEKTQYVANSIWNLQLAVVQDRAITIGKVAAAILLFIVGLIITRVMVLRYLYLLLKKLGVREGVAYTISQLLSYVLLLALLFGVIAYSGIPLSIFAFFGGALAIAAGFGAQKIVGSFLSGIILLLEGSIRAGDMVQVDGSKGRVKSVGLRHTQMTTFDNVDILIPNAKFLEESVINWTLESKVIRSTIAFGVNFDAPAEVVIDTLVQAAIDNENVLEDPVPEAFLEKINCDAGYLRFELYYWHQMPSPRERLVYNSALQIEIIRRLKEQGIRLASPTQNIITHTGPAVS